MFFKYLLKVVQVPNLKHLYFLLGTYYLLLFVH